MPSIVKRGPYQYQATVRRRGYKTQCKTFESRADAEAWAQAVESSMHSGKFRDPSGIKQVSLEQALRRYEEKVTPHKKRPQQERSRINMLCRHPMAQRYIAEMRACDFAEYRDERLKQVGPNTVRLELALLSHLYTIAIKEWSWPLEHEVRNVRKPKSPRGRERRLEDDEEQRLLAAIRLPSRRQCSLWLEACVRLAIETGMRAGEILDLEWSHVNLSRSVARLVDTKNNESRTVPLTCVAVDILRGLPREPGGRRVIRGFHDTNGLDAAFAIACRDAELEDLRFHDLRHEAASRMAPHMKPQELAKVFGWKTLQMAMRYYNPTDDELVRLVRRVERQMAAEGRDGSPGFAAAQHEVDALPLAA